MSFITEKSCISAKSALRFQSYYAIQAYPDRFIVEGLTVWGHLVI